MNEEEGSWGMGFIIGFFLGIIGVLIAAAIGKKQTLKGSGAGALVSFLITTVIACSSGLYQYNGYYNVGLLL